MSGNSNTTWTETLRSLVSDLVLDVLRPDRRPWTEKPVEPRIAPLVSALNAMPGVMTIASCQGHFALFEPRMAYVYFQAPTDFALALFMQVDRADDEGRFNYWWQIKPVSHRRRGLGWRLGMEQRFFTISRQKQDLSLLQSMVEEIACLNVRPSHERKVAACGNDDECAEECRMHTVARCEDRAGSEHA